MFAYVVRRLECVPTKQIVSSVGTYKLGSPQRELNVFWPDAILRTQNDTSPFPM